MNDQPRNFAPTDFSNHFGISQQREVPESLAAEQEFLGAVMLNNEVLDALKIPLDKMDFYEPLHRKIFEGMIDLRAQGKKANPVSLLPFLPTTEKVGDLTMAQYLARLATEACSVVLAPQHAQDIVKASAARDIVSYAMGMQDQAYDHWGELAFMDEIIKLTDQIRARAEELNVKEHKRPGDAYLDALNAAARNNGAVGVPIVLTEIQRVLNESMFEAGNLYGMLGSSGEGKTSLTSQIISHAIESGHPTEFLSYDQSQEQCIRQMIAQKYGIDAKQQKENRLSPRESDQCVLFANWVNQQPLDIYRCQREGVSRLISYAKRFIKRNENGKTPLIVVDHIGKIKARDERLSPDKIAGEITVELKSLADETKSAVILLNQRNGGGNSRLNPRPIGKDIYGGEGAKTDYDAIMYLYRPEKYRQDMLATAADERERSKIAAVFAEFGNDIETIAELGTIKVRFGDPTVRERVKFEGRYTRYTSMSPVDAQGRLM